MLVKLGSRFRFAVGISFLVCSAVLAADGRGGDAKDVKSTEPAAASASTVQQTPSSGDEMAPSAIAGTSLARSLKRDASVFTLRRGTGGFMSLNVGEGFRHAVVMYTGPDGKPVIGCITSEKEAEAIFGPKRPEIVNPRKEK